MLAKLLAIAVGCGSVTLYMAAFFFPEVHRRHDFFWSGVGMFYALVLWVGAGQMTTTVALGQGVSVVLLGWLGWQTLKLRRVTTPVELQTPATPESWRGFRQEMITLAREILGQLPLLRSLFAANGTPQTPAAVNPDGLNIRASSLREVGYEYLDDIEDDPIPVAPAPPKSATATAAPRSAVPACPLPARPAAKPSPPAKSSPPTKPVPPGDGPLAKAIIIKDWLGDVVRSLSAPKPTKPVIDIPPRSPSVPPPTDPEITPDADQESSGDDAAEVSDSPTEERHQTDTDIEDSATEPIDRSSSESAAIANRDQAPNHTALNDADSDDDEDWEISNW